MSNPRQISPLVGRSSELLQEMYSFEKSLFSYRTFGLEDGYKHEYSFPGAIRYTVNSLLGIKNFEDNLGEKLSIGNFEELFASFFKNNASEINRLSDKGLLLLLTADCNLEVTEQILEDIDEFDFSENLKSVNLQDLTWLLWGLSFAADNNFSEAAKLAHKVFDFLKEFFSDSEFNLPFFELKRYRKNYVSFGALVYYLKSLTVYDSIFDSMKAKELFEKTLKILLDSQGINGEWPWFYSVSKGIPVDFYPVYSVHQDSMAFLFLLPALKKGYSVKTHIRKSYNWLLGGNQFSNPLMERSPFIIYRSLRRGKGDKLTERLFRYLRAIKNDCFGFKDELSDNNALTINRECRSYHLGWVLYVWSETSKFEEFQYAEFFQ